VVMFFVKAVQLHLSGYHKTARNCHRARADRKRGELSHLSNRRGNGDTHIAISSGSALPAKSVERAAKHNHAVCPSASHRFAINECHLARKAEPDASTATR
jgi:hypothetical protein